MDRLDRLPSIKGKAKQGGQPGKRAHQDSRTMGSTPEYKKLPFSPGAIFSDFDGVLTDNRVWIDEKGKESIVCNRSDGLAADFLRARIPLVIVSTEKNGIVRRRAKKLRVEVHQGVRDKAETIRRLCGRRRISPSRAVYIGNDINDLGAMKLCGYSVAPADSHPRVLASADHVLTKRGGTGVLREFCEVFLGL